VRMIILAAGTGSRLAPLTDDRPKCLVELSGRPLLERQIETARRCGVDDIVVVTGYQADKIARYREVRTVENPDYAVTNMVRSLFKAQAWFGEGFIMSYADIVYSETVLRALLATDDDISVVVDEDWRSYWERRFDDPLSDAESLRRGPDGRLLDIGRKTTSYDRIDAQYIGLAAFRGAGVAALTAAYADAEREDAAGRPPFGGPRSLDRLYMTDLIQGLIDRGERVGTTPIHGGWVEVDSVSDLRLAEELAASGRLG
jgi:L-glutamine-phosphate cytidylyltransferase